MIPRKVREPLSHGILRLWRSKQIERCGEITDEIQYELHGVGCAIHFPSESVELFCRP
ncbi:DUF6896 domain-containing protein [Pseudomonas fluorescens]|uniref:DUF6896 domain-containing protein n=1 Tax=Pseudomonas fluorescens TaxID=294 RepID=UPI0038116FAC